LFEVNQLFTEHVDQIDGPVQEKKPSSQEAEIQDLERPRLAIVPEIVLGL
jgi:hypothetical protein